MRSGNTQYLHLPNASAYTAGRAIRVKYLAVPTSLSSDTDTLTVDTAPVSGPSGSTTFTVQFAPGGIGARPDPVGEVARLLLERSDPVLIRIVETRPDRDGVDRGRVDRKSTRLNSSHRT